MSLLPYLAWSAAVVLAVLLMRDTENLGVLTAAVDTTVETVGPLRTGRLEKLHIAVGMTVTAGTVVAEMDTTLFDLETALQEQRFLEAESSIAGYQEDVLQVVRQLNESRSAAIDALQRDTISHRSDQARLDVLQEEQARRSQMHEKGLIHERTLYELKPEIAALEAGLAEYPRRTAFHRRRIGEIDSTIEDMRRWMRLDESEAPAAAVLRRADARYEIQARLREINARRRDDYTLRASRDGVVSRVEYMPGDVVQSGATVVRIVAGNPDNVTGFLPEVYLSRVSEGRSAWVWRQGNPMRKTAAVVESVEPEVRALPGRISPVRGQSLRGRRVVFSLLESHDFLPGETVRVGFGQASLWHRINSRLRKRLDFVYPGDSST